MKKIRNEKLKILVVIQLYKKAKEKKETKKDRIKERNIVNYKLIKVKEKERERKEKRAK